MPDKTPEEQIAYVQRLMTSVTQTLESTRQELEELMFDPTDCDDIDVAAGTKSSARIKTLITTLSSLETSIVKLRINQTGAVDGCIPLDLERARLEIGSRLARLRAAASSGDVPE